MAITRIALFETDYDYELREAARVAAEFKRDNPYQTVRLRLTGQRGAQGAEMTVLPGMNSDDVTARIKEVQVTGEQPIKDRSV